MRKITALRVQRKNPQRVNVFLDGEFAFGLTRIVAGWLQIGQELDDKKIADLLADDNREMAYVRALNFLSYRPRSIAEIERNLRKHKLSETIIDATVERLKKNGFVNDQDFARIWVENRNTFRPRGQRALRQELRLKGITDEIIQNVLDDLVDDPALAYQAGIKKAKKLAHLEWEDFRRKLAAFLARRGFSYADIAPLLRPLWDEVRPEENTDLSL